MTTAKDIFTETSHPGKPLPQAQPQRPRASMRTLLLWSQALVFGFLALAMPHPAQAGKEMTFGDYTGSLQSLRLDSMPANTRVDTDNKSYINFFWEVKDKEGLINTALVQYRVYDRKTTNGYCGTMFSPQVCAFDQAGIRYAA